MPVMPKGRVLIADDEPPILRLYARGLEQAGFEVDSAPDGQTAKELVAQKHFDVIVSDMVMPGMNGIELLRAVRTRNPDVPVLIVTGKPSDDTVVEAVQLGALLYLTKPVALAELVQAVERACRLYQLAKVKREALTYLGGPGMLIGDRAGLEVGFERALSSLWMAYQPIVSWSHKNIFAHEAFMRSAEPMLLQPMALLAAAERLGKFQSLGRVVREQVASAAEGVSNCQLFMNLHSRELLDETLYSPSSSLAKVANKIVLEITEHAPLDVIKNIKSRMQELRGIGFRIALDDLGVGHAGLSHFALLEPEFVKLDVMLVRDIDTDSTKRRLIRSMTSLCHDLGIAVIAEGVETADALNALIDLGCDLHQGYQFAHPGRMFPNIQWSRSA